MARNEPAANVISVTHAKRDLVELVDRAAAGERFVVTKWGRPVAILQAHSESESDQATAS